MSNRTGLRMTLQTQLVLRAMLHEPGRAMYGLQICAESGLASGTIHPIMARLERLGWVDSQWEEADPHEQGRPRRRYYALTKDGAESARVALAQARTKVADIPVLRPRRPLGGTA